MDRIGVFGWFFWPRVVNFTPSGAWCLFRTVVLSLFWANLGVRELHRIGGSNLDPFFKGAGEVGSWFKP